MLDKIPVEILRAGWMGIPTKAVAVQICAEATQLQTYSDDPSC